MPLQVSFSGPLLPPTRSPDLSRSVPAGSPWPNREVSLASPASRAVILADRGREYGRYSPRRSRWRRSSPPWRLGLDACQNAYFVPLSSRWRGNHTGEFSHQFTVELAGFECRQVGLRFPQVDGDRLAGIALCEEKLLPESLLLLQHRHDGILDYSVRFVDLGRVKLDIDSSRIHGRPPSSRASSIRRSFRAGKRARRRSRWADGAGRAAPTW